MNDLTLLPFHLSALHMSLFRKAIYLSLFSTTWLLQWIVICKGNCFENIVFYYVFNLKKKIVEQSEKVFTKQYFCSNQIQSTGESAHILNQKHFRDKNENNFKIYAQNPNKH